MSPRDLGPTDELPMTTEKSDAAPLSENQIAALVETVSKALARGQSVQVMSEGRMLARYLPTRSSEANVGRPKRRPRRTK